MKTRNHYLILAAVLTILSAPALAKQAPSLPEDLPRPLIGRAHPELAGIDKLYVGIAINKQYVGVTPDIDDPQKNGLVWKELETRVMNRLLETGIKVVGNIKAVITVGLNISELSELRVNIDMLKLNNSQQYVVHIQTSLSRAVFLKYRPKLGLKADVWKTDAVMRLVPTQDMPTAVTNVILWQVDAFIFAHRLAKVSTGKLPPTDSIPIPPTRRGGDKPIVGTVIAEHKFVASKNSKVFHKPECHWVEQISPKNLIGYNSRDEAINAGRRPCKRCKP